MISNPTNDASDRNAEKDQDLEVREVHFDGGCDLETGVMETYVAHGGARVKRRGIVTVRRGRGRKGPRTNVDRKGSCNQAHWLAAVEGLQQALRKGVRNPIMVGDAKLVIDQADGPPSRCEDPVLREIRKRYLKLRPRFQSVDWRYCRPNENRAHVARRSD